MVTELTDMQAPGLSYESQADQLELLREVRLTAAAFAALRAPEMPPVPVPSPTGAHRQH